MKPQTNLKLCSKNVTAKKSKPQNNPLKTLHSNWDSNTYILRASVQGRTVEVTDFKHNSFMGCLAVLSEWFQS